MKKANNNNAMRVLHYIGALELGGSQSFVMELYRNINRTKLQFDFVIFPGWRGPLYDEILSLGGKIFECSKYNGLNHWRFISWWEKFLSDHPEYKVIHGHVRSVASIYLPIMRRHERFTILHSHSMSNGSGVAAMIKHVLQMPVRHMADYYMACSDDAGRWLFGERAVNGSRYKTVPNAINVKRFVYSADDRDNIRREYGIEDSFVIGHVGRFVKVKNHKFLLDMMEQLIKDHKEMNPVLLMIGDGPLKRSIENAAYEKGIENHMIFTGNRTDTQRFYSAMDVFTFPSKWEGLGIAAVEAQVSGLHCVISDGIPQNVDIGARLIERISVDDIGSWCEIMNRLYERRKQPAYNRESHIEEAVKSGYDIKKSVIVMQNFYLKISESQNKRNKTERTYIASGNNMKRKSKFGTHYIMRLDDASEHMNFKNWICMKELLDKYGMKPMYGIIPNNQDPELLKYKIVPDFWQMMRDWQNNGWVPALHGYEHIFETNDGGINPINNRSEFARVPLSAQKEKIRKGYATLKREGIKPSVFFAPAHTFDENTLKAIYDETDIRVICDTIAYDVYYRKPFYFIPQQSGRVRKLPFKTVTFCYHPNTMGDGDFEKLERFLRDHSKEFVGFKGDILVKRRRNAKDILLSGVYFGMQRMRRTISVKTE